MRYEDIRYDMTDIDMCIENIMISSFADDSLLKLPKMLIYDYSRLQDD